jgi:hypothetical protein
MDGVLYCKTHFEQLFKETGNFSKKFQGNLRLSTVLLFLVSEPVQSSPTCCLFGAAETLVLNSDAMQCNTQVEVEHLQTRTTRYYGSSDPLNKLFKSDKL